MTRSATKKTNPAAIKRGADPDVPQKAKHEVSRDPAERKLEQGLEESMAGSDPVSITQPAVDKPPHHDK